MLTQDCPCGSGLTYAACCGPLHQGTAEATSAEQLMRSRYSAYALGELDHVFRTWHPRTRPPTVEPEPGVTWTGLSVLGSGEDWVEFRAAWSHGPRSGVLHEWSRFEQRRGRWVYVEGEVR